MDSGLGDLYQRYTRVQRGRTSAKVLTREEFDEAVQAVQSKVDEHLRRATFPVTVNRLSRALDASEVLVRIIFEAKPHELVIVPEDDV